MNDSMGSIFSALEQDICKPMYRRRFLEAGQRHLELGRFASVTELLHAMGVTGTLTKQEKDGLTRILVDEWLGSNRHTLWSSLLLVAYEPMLKGIRRGIRGTAMESEDLNQLIMTSFLETVEGVAKRPEWQHVPARLLCRTRRRVFGALGMDQKAQEALVSDPETLLQESYQPMPETANKAPYGPSNPQDAAEAVGTLVEHAGDLVDGMTFDMLTFTLVCQRKLRSGLEDLHPETNGMSPPQRSRFYQRIKRRHSRALARVRPAIINERWPDDTGEEAA